MNLFPSLRRHYWIDDLDPWIVHFSGNSGIRWYGLSYTAGILFVAWVFLRWAQQGRLPLPVDQVTELIAYAATGVLAGGRLGYCIFYNAHEVIRHPWEIVAIWHVAWPAMAASSDSSSGSGCSLAGTVSIHCNCSTPQQRSGRSGSPSGASPTSSMASFGDAQPRFGGRSSFLEPH